MNAVERRARRGGFSTPFWVWILVLLAFIPLAMVVTAKLDARSQLLFMIFTILGFVVLNFFKSRSVTVFLIVLSATVSTRYLYWRLTETLQFETLAEIFLGSGLFLAELYAFIVLMLGFVQSVWAYRRQPIPLPDNVQEWPIVDVYIPTYNESLQVVSNTVLGAMSMDYPADRFRVYLLDDGRRPEFEAFAAEVGCGYLSRGDNRHAKAGNLNNALKRTDGELIAIFDSDHVPTRAFLQMTVGSFLANDNLSLVQTPHHFYSPDPFERNVAGGDAVPNEGQLFYGLVQEGNDFWNAAFFCGSCAVLRRSALADIDGFATETVTEDAHTALKLHRNGWDSAYLRLPMAAGLATERLALHIGQRMRWARGMTQIFRLDNPLFGRGLSLSQRLCYLNAMLHFFFALPRFVFLTAPLAYLLFAQNIITSSWQMIFLYAFPHLVHSIFTNSRLQSRHRYTFWGEIYESVLSFHIMRPTLLTLINPRRGSFNVTEKGGLLPNSFFDSSRVVPHIVLAGFLMLGLILGVIRIALNETDAPFIDQVDVGVIILNMVWAAFNLLLVLAAISVARERRQVREHVRIPVRLATRLTFPDGAAIDTHSIDMSMGGGLYDLGSSGRSVVGQRVQADVTAGADTLRVTGEVVGLDGDHIRVRYDEGPLAQQRNLVRLIFGRADAWLRCDDQKADTLFRSFGAIFRGIGGMISGSREGRVRPRSSQAVGLALAAGIGLLALTAPYPAAAQVGQGTTLSAPPPPPSGRAVLQQPLTPPGMPAPVQQAQPQPGFGQPQPGFGQQFRTPSSSTIVDGQREGVPGQPRPAEPLMSVVPNTSFEGEAFVMLPQDAPVNPGGALDPVPGGSVTTSTLTEFNVEPSIVLRSVKGVRYIPFTLRSDQVVDKARLSLSFSYSQALLPETSSLMVYLNGSPVGRLKLLRSYAGGITAEMPINAALFKQENTFLIETDKHYTTACEDPLYEALHLTIDAKASKLELAVRPLQLVDDLALLPRPFVDEYDYKSEPLTFLLPPNPSDMVLQAAGIVASYFGDAGRRHGIKIEARYGGLDAGNVVVFRSGGAGPQGLNFDGPASQNAISIQGNPRDAGASKLLIVSGADDAGLVQAAQHLALGGRGHALSGPAVTVGGAPTMLERQPDDASRWIPLDRPVTLGEFVKRAENLQGVGPSGFISAPFVMPPRKLPDEQGGPRLRLEYDYPDMQFLDTTTSRFDVLLSDKFIKSLPLKPAEAIDKLAGIFKGPMDEEARSVVRIDPSVIVTPRNELQFFFDMKPIKQEECKGKLPVDMRFRIQPSSTLDFSDTIHYTPLPDVSYFASVGYPFTRMADLSETVVMLPANPDQNEVSAYLNIMALAGEATGDPATRVVVARPGGLGAHPDKDVLAIGAWQNLQAALQTWQGGGAFQFKDGSLRISSVSPIESMRYFFSGGADQSAERERADAILASQGQNFSGLVSFERPDASGRTVVMVAGGSPAATLELVERMRDPELRDSFKGDLVRMDVAGVTSFAVGPQFTVYSIPFWQRLRWYFADRPLLLIALLVIGVAFLSMILIWLLQRISAARANDAHQE